MTLADKVTTVLSSAAAPGFMDAVQSVQVYPRAGDGGLSEFETDCRDWGFVYGIA